MRDEAEVRELLFLIVFITWSERFDSGVFYLGAGFGLSVKHLLNMENPNFVSEIDASSPFFHELHEISSTQIFCLVSCL